MNKLIYNKNTKILFISATPRILDNNINLDIDENIFGKIEYSYSMGKAIKDKLITDYEIIVPSIFINQANGIEDIINIMSNKKYNKNLIIKARFIIKGMLETGSKKCIIYLQNQNEAEEFNNILKEIAFEYFAKYIYSTTIISDDNVSSRKIKIQNFKETNDILCFICSVQIMNEAIDIPCCDSIFLANTTDNKIKTIQRISRATRIDEHNLSKKAHIFIWCDDYYNNDLATFISNIKEYDENEKEILHYHRTRELFSIPQIFECYIPYCGIPDFNKVNEFLFKNGIHINMNTFKKNVGQSELSFIE